MGILKTLALMSGVPVRPTTTRERSRRYQRTVNQLADQQNQLLEAQLESQLDIQQRFERQQAELLGMKGPQQPANQPQEHASPGPLSAVERLEKLAKLRDAGVLTDQEFSEQKSSILTKEV